MRDSHGVIGFPGRSRDQAAEYVINGYSKSNVRPSAEQTLLKKQVAKSEDGTMVLFFERPLDHPSKQMRIHTNGVQKIIWAYSDSPKLGMHKRDGSMRVQLSKTGNSRQTMPRRRKSSHSMVKAHGILMWLSFGVLFPVGVLLAKLMPRDGDKPYWLILHRLIQLLAAVLVLISFGLIIANKLKKKFGHFQTTHAIMGLIVIVVSLLQILLAFVRPSPDSNRRRMWKIGHFVFGYGTLLFGACVVSTGFVEFLHFSPTKSMLGLSYAHVVIVGVFAISFLVLWLLSSCRKSRDTYEV